MLRHSVYHDSENFDGFVLSFISFVLSFISFVLLSPHSLLIQLEFTSFSHDIYIICFNISYIKIGLLYQVYLQDFAV